MKYEWNRLSTADRISGVATLVLFISLFLPWFGVTILFVSATASGLSAHGYLYIALILSVAVLGVMALRPVEPALLKLPFGHDALMLFATVVNFVLVLIGFLSKPGGAIVDWEWGSFVALAAAVVAVLPFVLPLIREIRWQPSSSAPTVGADKSEPEQRRSA